MGLFIIARDNIKKKKGNTLILFLLVALAVLLLYVGTSVLRNIDHLIDQRNDAINGADYFLQSASKYPDQIESLLNQQDGVKKVEREKGLDGIDLKYFRDGQSLEDAQQMEFLFLKKDRERTISVPNLIDQGKEWHQNSIILPYYMKAGMGFRTGDTIHMYYNKVEYDFEIYGFTEDVMFANPTNVAMEKSYIDSSQYELLKYDWNTATNIFRVELEDHSKSEQFEKDFIVVMNNEIADYNYSANMSLNYMNMKHGASVLAKMFVGMLTMFSILLIVISMVIIHFNINNTIEMSIRNIGILEAIGYRTGQLRLASYIEFLLVSVLGSLLGLGIARGAASFIGNILSSSIGLLWNLKFDTISALISVLITLLLVSITISISSLKYNRIKPLDALRNGIHVHNFKKNRIHLDQSKLPLNLSLGLKNIIFNKRKNIILCLIVLLFSFSMNLAFSMYHSFAKDPLNMLRITGVEMTDVVVTFQDNDMDRLKSSIKETKEKLQNYEEVDSVTEVDDKDLKIKCNGVEDTISSDIYEKTDILTINNIIKGRRPQYDNEIMITEPVAKQFNVAIGDTIYVKGEDKDYDYIIVGLSQGFNHFGKKLMITASGYNRINPNTSTNQVYVYLKPGVDISTAYHNLKNDLDSSTVTVANYHDYATTVLGSVNGIMVALCLIMMIVVIFVIALVLILMIKTQVTRDRKQYGVKKAVGYTTGQLLIQTILSYVPTVLIGAILGCVVAKFGMKQFFVVTLSSFGIKQIDIKMTLWLYMITVFAITGWSTLISALCAMRIRKISPSSMVREL